MSDSVRIPVQAPPEAELRLARLARLRFGSVKRGSINILGLEALETFARREEERLKLAPLTVEEKAALAVDVKAVRRNVRMNRSPHS